MSHSDGGVRDKVRGRGACSNESGRFESLRVEAFNDGWDAEPESGSPQSASSPATQVLPEQTKRILSSNQSPDLPFDRSINPYKGCEHGCIYCFARPTHAYLGMSPGIDFETRIFSKPRAAELLRKELSAKSWKPQTIALGANTDPYQPAERKLGITREILEVLDEARNPVTIVTKSALVLRDLDLLREMAARDQAGVFLSITTLDPQLQRVMEPRASSIDKRLETLRLLSDAGVPCGVLASPMIPALNDHELEGILEASSQAGATSANYLLIRLPLELKELFEEWLREHYPERADHVLSLIRGVHEGGLYRSEFGTRMRGSGAYADILQRRFEAAIKRLGLARRHVELDHKQFRRPSKEEDRRQMELF
jgi:DNA repair photolyase